MTFRLIVLFSLLALATPAVATAASRSQIIRDCEDDSRLSGTYTSGELRDARDNIPSDKDAYTDCGDVLRSAIAASARARAAQSGAGGGGGGTDGAGGSGGSGDSLSGGSSSGGGSSPSGGELNQLDTEAGERASPVASQDDLKELRATRENLPEVDVRGQRVVPGVQGVAGQAATATVPTPLVVVLALLGATALLALVSLARRRVLARRHA